MTIGYHEHMRNIERGDEMVFRVKRLSEAADIDPTKKNMRRLEKAVQKLNDHTEQMCKLYGVKLDDDSAEKAA